MDVHGRLLAINVTLTKRFSFLHPMGERLGCAARPDLAWLYQIIDGYAAAYSKVINRKTDRIGAANGNLNHQPNPALEPTATATSAVAQKLWRDR
jgi:hypothetical protein